MRRAAQVQKTVPAQLKLVQAQTTLSAEEVERILQQPDITSPLGLRDRTIFEVLYSTGIRRAEVCSLFIDHVMPDRHVPFVHRGKGQKDRYVPLGQRALNWIADYLEKPDHSWSMTTLSERTN